MTSDPTLLQRIRVVLVHTSHPGNIGAAARAIKNMGLSRLYLVKPKRFPDEEAVWRASNALDVLDNAVVVETLEEAIADCRLVVGTSARERTIPWPLLDPRHCAERMVPVLSQQGDVAVLFGREDRGLTNEELQRCNLHIHIPTNPEYSSLNIAMAVQVISYELRMACLADERGADEMADWDMAPATAANLERLFVHMEEALTDMGFLKPKAPKQLMTRLRRLFHRTRMDEMEVNILRGILTSAQQWVARARDAERRQQGDAEAPAPGPDRIDP